MHVHTYICFLVGLGLTPKKARQLVCLCVRRKLQKSGVLIGHLSLQVTTWKNELSFCMIWNISQFHFLQGPPYFPLISAISLDLVSRFKRFLIWTFETLFWSVLSLIDH